MEVQKSPRNLINDKDSKENVQGLRTSLLVNEGVDCKKPSISSPPLEEGKSSNIIFQNQPPETRRESSNSKKKSPSCIKEATIIHFRNKNITLTEDNYGYVKNENLCDIPVQRFTWKNHNNIEAQIITYGARIISLKIPDKKGIPEDVVLGFDNLTDYVTHAQHFFGATIGRVTGLVENSTFIIDGKQYWVSSNDGKHHSNGGCKGLDKVVWNSSVKKTQVILSYIIPDGHEGYPGDLFIEVTFELMPKNEFTINMEATCTKPTIVNLSNLCYFNLAGHASGPNEVYKHTITINSYSYTDMNKRNLPTGQILKTVYTKHDFQMPVILKKRIGPELSDGYDQNLCVNRELGEDDCFVARALHVPSGRILELYSNQYGVRFTTANDLYVAEFPNTLHMSTTDFNQLFAVPNVNSKPTTSSHNVLFMLLVNIYEKMKEIKELDENNINEIFNLLKEIHSLDLNLSNIVISKTLIANANLQSKSIIAVVRKARELVQSYMPSYIQNDKQWDQLKGIVNGILRTLQNMDSIANSYVDMSNAPQTQSTSSKVAKKVLLKLSSGSGAITPNASKSIDTWVQDMLQKQIFEILSSKSVIEDASLKPSASVCRNMNIIGKGGIVYTKHSGVAFQSQNYPNAIYHKNFPNCVLKPGEMYKHKIIYRFWVQSGNPTRWLKREFE